MTQAESGLWRMRMALADEVIEAEVRGSGIRQERNAPQPGFMSVPFTGESAGRFWVITYFGHHHQAATGEWRATGSGVSATRWASRVSPRSSRPSFRMGGRRFPASTNERIRIAESGHPLPRSPPNLEERESETPRSTGLPDQGG